MERQEIFDGLFLGNPTQTATQPTWTKRTMFKISIALPLLRYAAPLNKEGNSNMAKISIETHTNDNPNSREWHFGRDVTSHYQKLYISVP